MTEVTDEDKKRRSTNRYQMTERGSDSEKSACSAQDSEKSLEIHGILRNIDFYIKFDKCTLREKFAECENEPKTTTEKDKRKIIRGNMKLFKELLKRIIER